MEVVDLIKMMRKQYNKKCSIYDYLGNYKGEKSIPLYYSDTKKLLFPTLYFTEKEVLEIKELFEKQISKNKMQYDLIYIKNSYAEALHYKAYQIKFKKIK